MSKCELCGDESGNLSEVKIEGAQLSVCDSCADMGEELKSNTTKVKKKSSRKGGRTKEKVLKTDYGKIVKKSREEMGISQGEMSDKINEKTSLISKIEKGDLKPDRSLANKLETELGVELYTNPKVNSYNDVKASESQNATVGDIADLKD